MTEQSVFDAARSLPEGSRAHLAQASLASLPEEPTEFAAGELPQAWLEEIRRRRREIDEGRVELVAGEVIIKRLRQTIGR